MNRTALKRHLLLLSLGLIFLSLSNRAPAQLSSKDEERLQILSDPEALKKKMEKDKTRAPYEFFRSQVAPFDVLPFVKPHQWCTLTLEVRANYEDYDGSLQSYPVMLAGMPQEIVFAREARLVKEQRARLGMQLLLPRIPKEKELSLELLRQGAIHHDELWQAQLRPLPPHQMLVVVLSKDSTNQYATWNRMGGFIPASSEREDTPSLELQRYYRLVLPIESDKPFLSPHPLTWAPISHIIWDGLPPDSIPVSHQQAMLDWLHWGGQIVLIGGAGPTFSTFRDSFLAPYLPAETTGDNAQLNEADLRPLSRSYPPPAVAAAVGSDAGGAPTTATEIIRQFGGPYRPSVPIQPPANRPVFLAGLKPHPGAATIPLGESSSHLLAVEARVGRGRITMLTINPTDPALASWPGLDTLVRRLVLRRPEEAPNRPVGSDRYGSPQPTRQVLEGPDLSWYRIASRDAGYETEHLRSRAAQAARQAAPVGRFGLPQPGPNGAGSSSMTSDQEEVAMNRLGVAEWRDNSPLPRLCRDLLEKASGISIPSSDFVLKVILAYLLAVVPLNWLLCRVVLRRREWAWALVPLVALGFAVGVERVAAYDMGYDSACDEIDVLEIHGGYSRAHLSRFASLYTTGRGKYTISYSNDPTALALPLDNGRSIGGEDVTTSVWQSYPVPALHGFSVQPRSLAMFRAEQMLNLSGPISLAGDEANRMLVNQSDVELRDAVLVDFPGSGEPRQIYLGTIAPGASLPLGEAGAGEVPEEIKGFEGPDPAPLLAELRQSQEPTRPENNGELRLVAWTPGPVGGQSFEPTLDRHRGLTVVVVHLKFGNPPSPEGPRFNLLAAGAEQSVPPAPRQIRENAMPTGRGGARVSRVRGMVGQ